MATHVIAQNSLFGDTARPEWDRHGKMDRSLTQLCDELYDHRMREALADLDPCLYWDESSERILADDGCTADPSDLPAWWTEISRRIADEIMGMDVDELQLAHNAEI